MLLRALASPGGVTSSTLHWLRVTAPQQLARGSQALAVCWVGLGTLYFLGFPGFRVGFGSCSCLHQNWLLPVQGCYPESRDCSILVPLSHAAAPMCSSSHVHGCCQQVVQPLLFWIGSSAPCWFGTLEVNNCGTYF